MGMQAGPLRNARWVAACALLTVCAALPGAGAGRITFQTHDNRTEVLLDGKPLTAFIFDAKWDKPFLFPIRTASGKEISRGYPVAPRPGEQTDHDWHRGIWYGHGDVSGEDFWREKKDGTTSRLVMDGPPKTSGNALEATLAMRDRSGKRIGTIRERYGFSAEGRNVLIDTTITVQADGGQALKFGDSDDGGFAFRLADEFREDRGATLTNSEGLTGTGKIWGQPAKWVHYSAPFAGDRAGVVILDHPSNLRHPTRWHARGYSLNAANPFALGSFSKSKGREGDYTLPAGSKLQLRYLVVIHDGELNRDAIEGIYARYAKKKSS